MQRLLKSIFFLTVLNVFVISCTKDKLSVQDNECLETITYDNHIREIINNSCAYTGCHTVGFIKGNQTTYANLKPQLDNGLFEKWVLNDRAMPPSYAPAGKPKSLTTEELELISCWMEQGYLEN